MDLDPGRVALRRLNRAEYDNTVRDLLGTGLRPAQGFAVDPAALGFDNNGDVQAVGAIQLEHYENAAQALADEVLAGGAARLAQVARVPACDPAREGRACVARLVSGFARRAWRRPPAADEIGRVMAVADGEQRRGGDGLAQLRLAVAVVLTSPHFLFRAEPDPRPGAVRALDDHEVASRLSYLIYASMPDDPLFAAADAGKLRTPAEVRAQAARMLADPRGAAFVASFAGQWLELAGLEDHDVDPALFGRSFDRALATAMKSETLGLFAEFVRGDRPAQELLSAPSMVADARLAQHYGAPAGAPPRRGLLTHASVLTATSAANGTNPVARGQWVLSRLFCAPPPPPPPDIPDLPDATPTGKTLRDRLEAHRTNPVCAACHRLFDPIGLGLENYDAIGRWRAMDAGEVIDASGELIDGTRFAGPAELIAALARDPRLSACVAEQLFIYALGRAPAAAPADAANLARLQAGAGGAAAGVRSLISTLVESDVFRMRRGEP
jgi:hypothetical protein